MEYAQVPVDVQGPISPARLWQPLAALFLVPEASVQRFLIASHRGDHLLDRWQTATPYGGLRAVMADTISAMMADVSYTALARSVGIQTDLGLTVEPPL